MSIPAPRDKSMSGLLKELWDRIGLVERRLAIGPAVPLPVRGTPAERDAAYGVPATAAEKAALANQQVVWFNTAKGWAEVYYAPAGTAGLTARPLVASAAAGWYPTGRADTHFVCKTNGFQAVPSGAANIVGFVTRHKAGDIVLSADRLVAPRAGMYELLGKTYISGSSASISLGFNIAGTGPDVNATNCFPSALSMTATTSDDAESFGGVARIPTGAGVCMGVNINGVSSGSGSPNIWGDGANYGWGTNFRMTYVGPPFADN